MYRIYLNVQNDPQSQQCLYKQYTVICITPKHYNNVSIFIFYIGNIVHTILLYWLACLVKSEYVFEKHVSGKWCHRTFSKVAFSLLFPRHDQNTLKEKRFIGLRFIYVDNDV